MTPVVITNEVVTVYLAYAQFATELNSRVHMSSVPFSETYAQTVVAVTLFGLVLVRLTWVAKGWM